MKKILSLLIILLAMTLLSSCDLFGPEVIDDPLSYTLNDDGNSYYVSGFCAIGGNVEYTETENVVIPATYNGLPVTGIGAWAFGNSSSLKSIVIPDSVTTIEDSAFYSCVALSSIKLGSSVAKIGDAAFHGCSSLTSIELPESLISIGNYAFARTSIESIIIPDKVTGIGNFAFEGCNSLIHVTLGSSIKTLGDAALCQSISTIVFKGEIPYYYDSYSCLFNLTSITIGDKATEIKDGTFNACSFKEVKLGNSITKIGDNAFSNCYELTSIIIPDSVTHIGEAAFEDCDLLTSVSIGKSVESIGLGAFWGCDSLENIYHSGDVETWLSIEMEDALTFNSYNLYFQNKLVENLVVTDSVNAIGKFAFYGCASLKSIFIPESVTVIEEFAFCGCTALSDVKLPDTMTTIKFRAFENCTSLSEITLPKSLVTIEYSAFYRSALASIIYSGDKEQWNALARSSDWYYGLNNVEVTIGNVHTHTYSAEVVEPTCTSRGYTTYTCSGCGNVYHDNYTSAKGHSWVDATCTVPKTCSVCSVTQGAALGHSFGDWVTVEEATVDKEGLMERYCECGESESKIIPKILIDSEGLAFELNEDNKSYSVVGIGTCSDTDIVIPSTYEGLPVTHIGNLAFINATNITSVVIPDSVIVIGDGAFSQCASLSSVTIGNSVETIGELAFDNCSLTEINIPDSVLTIKLGAFAYCRLLTKATLGNSVTSIGDGAFMCCPSLKSLNIPKSVTELGTGIVTLSDNIATIDYDGTMRDWSILLASAGASGLESGDQTIYCTDGYIWHGNKHYYE